MRALALMALSGCGAFLVNVPEKCVDLNVAMEAAPPASFGLYQNTQTDALPMGLIRGFSQLRELHITRGWLKPPTSSGLNAFSASALGSMGSAPLVVFVRDQGDSSDTIPIAPSTINLITYTDARGVLRLQLAFTGTGDVLADSWSLGAHVCLTGRAAP